MGPQNFLGLCEVVVFAYVILLSSDYGFRYFDFAFGSMLDGAYDL